MDQKIVYQTDRRGVYVCPAFADLVEGDWVIPGGAYEDAPPDTGPFECAVRRDGNWAVEPNYVGVVYWLPDGSEHVINEIGVSPPQGALREKPDETEVALTVETLGLICGRALDSKLDAIAISWRYKSYLHAAQAKGDDNPQFDAEGTAIKAYWSACWTRMDELEAAVMSGSAPLPGSVADVLAMMPPEPDRPVI